jgi:hypothetical protein
MVWRLRPLLFREYAHRIVEKPATESCIQVEKKPHGQWRLASIVVGVSRIHNCQAIRDVQEMHCIALGMLLLLCKERIPEQCNRLQALLDVLLL